MKFIAILASTAALATYVQALNTLFDTFYDDANRPLTDVACAGAAGLAALNPITFRDLPTFPFIGGAPAIMTFDDPNCGSCWNLTFTNSSGDGQSKSITITGIDIGGPDFFDISETAFNTLTAGQAGQAPTLEEVPVTAARLPSSACGF